MLEAAEILTRYTKLAQLAFFRTGSLLALPFPDSCFDGILCQHVLLNIEDKSGAIREFYRVLKPGGQLIIHEIARDRDRPVVMPVPWAAVQGTSFLESWEACESLMKDSGFVTAYFQDETRTGLAWWEKIKAAAEKNPDRPFPLGVHLIFGENASQFKETMPQNFRNQSICLVEAILKKT